MPTITDDTADNGKPATLVTYSPDEVFALIRADFERRFRSKLPEGSEIWMHDGDPSHVLGNRAYILIPQAEAIAAE